MRRLGWLSGCWMTAAVVMMASCADDINPQPEPPGFDGISGNGSAGGSSAVSGTGGSYIMATGGHVSQGGAMSTGGAGFAGAAHVGGATYQSTGTGGATSAGGGGDSGLNDDAGVACSSDAAVGTMPDASSSGCLPSDN